MNKSAAIILILFLNIIVSAAVAQQVAKSYVKSNPKEIIESLQAYASTKGETDSKQAAENLKKLDAETKAGNNDPFIGNPNGHKLVVEFFDYNCGYCKKVFPEVMKLVGNDPDVKVVMKELPILGPTSELASKAALAIHAKQPDKYFIFHQKLMEFKEQKTMESLLHIASESGVNFDLVKEMENPEYKKIIDANRDLASSLGISGTPSFAINGVLIPGAADAETIEKIIAETSKAQAAKN